ncbi:MAG: MFS transporter [Ruminococcaceae bacterium]|nr:MFS transporter [Oscillospiraceae bacterium]
MNYKKTRIACYTGYVTQAIVVNLAPLLFVIFQKDFDFSLSFIAAITLITFLLQMGIDIAAIYFVEKTSYRILAVSSQLTACIGLCLMAFLPRIMMPEAGILLAVLVYSTGSGLCEVVLSPLIEAIPKGGGENRSSMTLMHSFYAWGQAAVILITTVLLRFIGDGLWWVIPLVWALIPLFNTIAFMRVPLADMTVHEEGSGIRKMLRRPEFLVAFMLMICSGASEQAMAQWASMFCETGLGVAKVVGDILGPCMFAVMMGIGRTLHGLFGAKLQMQRLLLWLSVFCVGCYAVTVFVPVPFLSLLSCGLCGLGVSVMWPGMLALCSSKYPLAGASMFAILALGGDIGCSVGPWLTGTVSDAVVKLVNSSENIFNIAKRAGLTADQLGLRAGFLSAMIFPALMILGVVLLSISDKRTNEKK